MASVLFDKGKEGLQEHLVLESAEFEGIEQSEIFNQLNYLFLFDPFMKISEREDFDPANPDLTVLSKEDYEHMRALNRLLLTDYLHSIDEDGLTENTYSSTIQHIINLDGHEQ
jgi:hypothetical protein